MNTSTARHPHFAYPTCGPESVPKRPATPPIFGGNTVQNWRKERLLRGDHKGEKNSLSQKIFWYVPFWVPFNNNAAAARGGAVRIALGLY